MENQRDSIFQKDEPPKIEACLLHDSVIADATFDYPVSDEYFGGVRYGLCNSCIRHAGSLKNTIDNEIKNRITQLKRSKNV